MSSINIRVSHARTGTLVIVSYEGTTVQETFRMPDRRLTMAEAVALVAVNLRMNGPQEEVMKAREHDGDDNHKGVLRYTDQSVR